MNVFIPPHIYNIVFVVANLQKKMMRHDFYYFKF